MTYSDDCLQPVTTETAQKKLCKTQHTTTANFIISLDISPPLYKVRQKLTTREAL